MRPKWLLMIPVGIAAIAFFVFIGGTITQLLWNWLLPPLFGWKELSFWQALAMLTLCRILFGGISSRGGYGGRSRWTAEEKARFRQRIREKCGWEPAGNQP
jgi:hypothetical protein